MRTGVKVFILLPLLLLEISAGYSQLNSKMIGQIDRLTRSYNKLNRFSGVFIIADTQHVLYQSTSGYADIRRHKKIDLNTLFDAGSLSKQFTAVLILKLEAEGKLSVNDEAGKYFPEFPVLATRKITIHQLLTHSSGMPSLGRSDGITDVSPTAAAITIDSLTRIYINRSLQFEPGTKYNYSNSGYQLLAAIIERVTRQTYGENVAALFKQANMKQSGYGLFKAQKAVGYMGYWPDVKEIAFQHPSWNVGAGGIWTSASDLLKWQHILLSDAVLPKYERDKLFEKQIKRGGKNQFYGYAWNIASVENYQDIHHNGTTEGFISEFHYLTNPGLVLITLSNYQPEFGINTGRELIDDAIKLMAGKEVEYPPTPVVVPRADQAQWEGSYRFDAIHAMRILLKNGKLTATAAGQPWSALSYDDMQKYKDKESSIVRGRDLVDLFFKNDSDAIISALPKRIQDLIKAQKSSGIPKAYALTIGTYGKALKIIPSNYTARDGEEIITYLIKYKNAMGYFTISLNENKQLVGFKYGKAAPGVMHLIPLAANKFLLDGFAYQKDDAFLTFNKANGKRSVRLENGYGSFQGK